MFTAIYLFTVYFKDLLDEEFSEGVIKIASVDELTDHLQEWLHRLTEDRSQEVNCLQVCLTANQYFVKVSEERGSSGELSKPRLVADHLKVLLKRRQQRAVLVQPYASSSTSLVRAAYLRASSPSHPSVMTCS